MITQTSISYYGLNYVEHAEADFKEMKAHGVTQVILAVTEFDFDFWRPNMSLGFAYSSIRGATASISAASRFPSSCRITSRTARCRL